MLDTTTCPQRRAMAEVRERVVLDSTDGPIEHARTFCVRGHPCIVPVAALAHPTRQHRAEVHVPAGQADMVDRRNPGEGGPMRILLCSVFNGLSHEVVAEAATPS